MGPSSHYQIRSPIRSTAPTQPNISHDTSPTTEKNISSLVHESYAYNRGLSSVTSFVSSIGGEGDESGVDAVVVGDIVVTAGNIYENDYCDLTYSGDRIDFTPIVIKEDANGNFIDGIFGSRFSKIAHLDVIDDKTIQAAGSYYHSFSIYHLDLESLSVVNYGLFQVNGCYDFGDCPVKGADSSAKGTAVVGFDDTYALILRADSNLKADIFTGMESADDINMRHYDVDYTDAGNARLFGDFYPADRDTDYYFHVSLLKSDDTFKFSNKCKHDYFYSPVDMNVYDGKMVVTGDEITFASDSSSGLAFFNNNGVLKQSLGLTFDNINIYLGGSTVTEDGNFVGAGNGYDYNVNKNTAFIFQLGLIEDLIDDVVTEMEWGTLLYSDEALTVSSIKLFDEGFVLSGEIDGDVLTIAISFSGEIVGEIDGRISGIGSTTTVYIENIFDDTECVAFTPLLSSIQVLEEEADEIYARGITLYNGGEGEVLCDLSWLDTDPEGFKAVVSVATVAAVLIIACPLWKKFHYESFNTFCHELFECCAQEDHLP